MGWGRVRGGGGEEGGCDGGGGGGMERRRRRCLSCVLSEPDQGGQDGRGTVGNSLPISPGDYSDVQIDLTFRSVSCAAPL